MMVGSGNELASSASLEPAPARHDVNPSRSFAPSGGSQTGRSLWHDTPSTSSAPTSDRLTPDSDSDDDVAVVDDDVLLGAEAYELQDRDPEKRHPSSGTSSQAADDRYASADESLVRAQRRRPSVSTTASFQLYTPDEEQAVVRKFDRRLVLFVALLYMLSFLDRSSACTSPLPCKITQHSNDCPVCSLVVWPSSLSPLPRLGTGSFLFFSSPDPSF